MSRNSSSGSDRRNEDDPKSPTYPTKERDLASLIRQKNEEIEKLKEQVDKHNQKIDFQEKEIDSLKKRIAELEEEVRQLKETLISLQGDRNILLIGEVCRKFQTNLYQYVFPRRRLSSYYSYKMADLEQDIEKIKLHREKVKAKKRWEQFKQKEDPQKFQKLVEELQKLRNTTAHPGMTDLNVNDVLKAAEEVNEQGDFEFLDRTEFNFENVKELIEMWDRTEQYVKDPKTSTSA